MLIKVKLMYYNLLKNGKAHIKSIGKVCKFLCPLSRWQISVGGRLKVWKNPVTGEGTVTGTLTQEGVFLAVGGE